MTVSDSVLCAEAAAVSDIKVSELAVSVVKHI